MVYFMFVILEIFRYRRGWVTLSAIFKRKGALPTNHCWCQKTTVIAVSCDVRISAVHCVVLSQSTRVTDRRTELFNGYKYKLSNAKSTNCIVRTNAESDEKSTIFYSILFQIFIINFFG